MEKNLITRFSVRRKFWHCISSPFAGLVLVLSLAISNVPNLEANAAEVLPAHKQVQIDSETAQNTELKPISSTFPANGTYLYGQSPEANQVGSSYAVIEVTDESAVGAFYMPYSSFDCFYGDVESEQLNLTVINSYEQIAYSYVMPMEASEAIASSSGAATGLPQLIGYHAIDTLSDADHQMLATCRANYLDSI